MELATPLTKPTVGRTFYVAISVIGTVALLQLASVGYVFIKRYHASPVIRNSNIPVPLPKAGSTAAVPATDPTLDVTDTFAAAESTPPVSLPKPTPVASIATPSPESRLTEMLDQARILRDRGDTNTALTRLREALATAPDNPLIISEIATTYEKMSLPDKAIEQWRRIYDQGETAGIFYAAADAKLKANDAHAARLAAEKEVAATAVARDPAGFQPGATLALGEIVRSDTDARKLAIKIPIKSRPDKPVEVREVVIQVFFYDMLPDASIVQTNANVSSNWSTVPADWADGDVEVLDVQYAQVAADPKDKDKSRNDRKFYGYVVRVYYKSELQAYRAEPVKLLTEYPPPVTLPTE